MTIPSTVGSSKRLTKCSSKGNDALVVAHEVDPGDDRAGRRRPDSRGGQRRLVLRLVTPGDEARQRLVLEHLGIVAEEPGDHARDGLDPSVFGHQHDDRPRVVDQRAKAVLVSGGQLVAATLGQVAHAQQDDVGAEPVGGAADHLDEAPARCCLDPDLNGRADLLLLNAGERAQHELLVVGVHQVQARLPDPIAERALEHPFGRTIRPDDGPRAVDHDDCIGQAQERVDHGADLGIVGRLLGWSWALVARAATGPLARPRRPRAASLSLSIEPPSAPTLTELSADVHRSMVAIGLQAGSGRTLVPPLLSYRTRCSIDSGFAMFSFMCASCSSGDSLERMRKGETIRPSTTHPAAMSSASW